MASKETKTEFRTLSASYGEQRSSLISILLIIGLTVLSWISTYTGMLELITANAGEIGTLAMVAIGFAVAVLQLMILYVLDSLFSRGFYFREFGEFRKTAIPLAVMFFIGYMLLSVISVGFGFGFYWKFLEARTQTTASAEASIAQVQAALQLGQSRLEQLQSTFATLATTSTEKAEKERTEGGTCPNSPPGDGPRRRLRDADAQRFSFANTYVGDRVATVKADIATINDDLVKVLANDPSTIDPVTKTRNAYLRELNRKLGLAATRFNALRSDPQLLQIRDELATRAAQVNFPNDRGGTFTCPDPQIQTALNGAVRAIDNLPVLETPEILAVEGSEAVIEAFRRLTTSIFGVLSLQRPPTPEEVRASQREAATASAEAGGSALSADQSGLGKRDYIPLAIAIFVDFCILLVSMNRPLRGPFDRLFGRVKAAETGQMNKFLTIFYQVFQDQFRREPEALEEFAPVQDVVFDYEGDYYAAVPLKFKDYVIDQNGSREYSATTGQPLHHAMSRYIANVFVALEGEGFVKLDYSLDDKTVQKELENQESQFADAETYRVYKFRDGAWADIVTRSVVSAHKQQMAREKFQERVRSDKLKWPPLPGRGGGPIDRGTLGAPKAGGEEKVPDQPKQIEARKPFGLIPSDKQSETGESRDPDPDINQENPKERDSFSPILNGKSKKPDA